MFNGSDIAIMQPTTREQLQQFIGCIFEPNDIVEARFLPAKNSNWYPAAELSTHANELAALNDSGQHIYVGVNPRADIGGTTAKDVSVARCLFVDFDHTTPEQVQSLLDDMEFPQPTLMMNSGHGVHCHWRLTEPITDLNLWTAYQKRLIVTLDSDKAIHDPPRIMRLPGFINHKQPVTQSYIIDADPARIYLLADIEENLVEIEPPKAAPTRRIAPPASSDETERRVRAYVATWEGEAEGGRNNAAMRHSASLTRDWGLSYDDAWPYLWNWNLTNSPPLDEAELRKALTNGEKYGTHPVGGKLIERRTPKSTKPATTPETPKLDDIGNGQRFALQHSKKMRFNHTDRKWYFFDGIKWNSEKGRGTAEKLAKATARAIVKEANDVDHDEEGRIYTWAHRSGTAQKIDAMLKMAQSEESIAVYREDFDKDPYAFNTLNKTLFIGDPVKVRDHNPDDLITKTANAKYDPDADCDPWLECLYTCHLLKIDVAFEQLRNVF